VGSNRDEIAMALMTLIHSANVGMRRIMRNRIDAGLRNDFSGLEFLRHNSPPT
jgi:hypothetical protein